MYQTFIKHPPPAGLRHRRVTSQPYKLTSQNTPQAWADQDSWSPLLWGVGVVDIAVKET